MIPFDEIRAPATVSVVVTCPTCGAIATLPVKVSSRQVRDDDDSGSLAVRVRVTKMPHLCGQLTLTLVDVDKPVGGPDDGAP